MQEGEAWRSITVIQQQGLRACVLMFAAASFLGSPIARAPSPGLGRLWCFIIDAPSRHGRLGADHSLWWQSERVHALSNGWWRIWSIISGPEFFDDRIGPELVSPVLNESGDGHAKGAIRRRNRARHERLVALANLRSRNGPIDERRWPERDASRLRISVLSAKPARVFNSVHGDAFHVRLDVHQHVPDRGHIMLDAVLDGMGNRVADFNG